VERGVFVGGLMICGSFLLAALLNRSAMEELPATAPVAPATVVAPIAPAASETEIAPSQMECTEASMRTDADSHVAPAEQAISDKCDPSRLSVP
jgi:hypothetical protein